LKDSLQKSSGDYPGRGFAILSWKQIQNNPDLFGQIKIFWQAYPQVQQNHSFLQRLKAHCNRLLH
jgi:hypothetical protein